MDFLHELHVADTRDDGQHFSPLSAAFFGLLFGVEARRFRIANSSRRFVDTQQSLSTRQKQQQQHSSVWAQRSTFSC